MKLSDTGLWPTGHQFINVILEYTDHWSGCLGFLPRPQMTGINSLLSLPPQSFQYVFMFCSKRSSVT